MEYYGYNEYCGYLSHYGIAGMKWGKRNGPPYPLSKAKSQAVKKAGKKRQTFAEKRAEKKRKKQEAAAEAAKAKKAAEEAKAAYEKEHYEENKQKALRSGSAKDILKYQGDVDNKDLIDALNRIKWEAELRQIAANESDAAKNRKKVDNFFNGVNATVKYATTVYTAATLVKKYQKLIEEAQKKAG